MMELNAFQGEEHQPFTLRGTLNGHAVLLVHGFPGTPAEMRPLAEALHDSGWTVTAPLLPGFGPDVETLAERTMEEWVAAVNAALANLQRDYETVILGGFSLGGALAMQVAASSSKTPDALLLLAPFWQVDHFLWKGLPVLKHIFPQPKIFKLLNLDFNDPNVRDGIHNFMPEADLDDPETQQAIREYAMPVKMFAQIHRAGGLAYNHAPQLQMPCLVVQGKTDELVKPNFTRRMIARIAGSVDFHMVDGEHDIPQPDSAGWQATRQHVLDFANQFTVKEAQE